MMVYSLFVKLLYIYINCINGKKKKKGKKREGGVHTTYACMYVTYLCTHKEERWDPGQRKKRGEVGPIVFGLF